jgi:hypothetical protein
MDDLERASERRYRIAESLAAAMALVTCLSFGLSVLWELL